ncbi:FxsA family membrane protein [Streptomyces sp. NPDC058045]|uniref:FxsA family membrane protein n=1 Tax=Streptomyces sp. NPDC058045 TaxID=3346311 RepID=UPI0036E49AB2
MTTGAPPPHTARPRPSGPRRYLPLAFAAWLVLEIWLLTVIAGAVGGLAVFLLLVAGVVVGAAVMKQAGRRAFDKLSRTLRQVQETGRPPAEEGRGEGNGLLMLAGLLIMIPGPLSDAAGLLLLLPPVRRLASRTVERRMEHRMRTVGPGTLGNAFQQARMHRPDGKVVPGEVVREDKPEDGDDQTPRPPLTP